MGKRRKKNMKKITRKYGRYNKRQRRNKKIAQSIKIMFYISLITFLGGTIVLSFLKLFVFPENIDKLL